MSKSELAQRMAKSVGATVLLLFVLAVFPYLFVVRFSDGLGDGFRPNDLALAFGVGAWILAGAALLDRDDTPEKPKLVPWFLHVFMTDLVETSFFGVGAWDSSMALHNPAVHTGWLTSAVLDETLLAPAGVRSAASPSERSSGTGDDADDIVILRRRQKKESILAGVATTTYEVQRGDTWWSMAEQFINDGRKWKDLREINLGHEPTPGVIIDGGINSTPLIGWSVLVPAEIIESEEDENEVEIASSLFDVAREALT